MGGLGYRSLGCGGLGCGSLGSVLVPLLFGAELVIIIITKMSFKMHLK